MLYSKQHSISQKMFLIIIIMLNVKIISSFRFHWFKLEKICCGHISKLENVQESLNTLSSLKCSRLHTIVKHFLAFTKKQSAIKLFARVDLASKFSCIIKIKLIYDVWQFLNKFQNYHFCLFVTFVVSVFTWQPWIMPNNNNFKFKLKAC